MESNWIDSIIHLDKDLLLFLNGLGSATWDPFWLLITNQFNWSPVFLFIIVFVFLKFGWKKGSFFLFAVIVLVAFSDQFVNLIKDSVGRLRPNNDPQISHLVRALLQPKSHSFVSGHATTSMFFSVFCILWLKKEYRYIYLLLIFPLVFGYSRIYLGVHFPLDILSGYLLGILLATLYYKLFTCGLHKFFN